MDLLTYLHVIQYRKQLILLVALFAAIGAAIGRMQMPVKYETSAVVRLMPYSTSNPSYTQLTYADRIMKTYVEIGSGSVIMSNLREDLGLAPNQPASVSIDIIPDTELLRITVADYNPVLASDIANALVGYLINDNSIRDVHVILMEPASIPEPPSKLSMIAFYVLAMLIGLIGGVGSAFLFENIDPRLYDEKQVENVSKLPVLGCIPSISAWRAKKLVAGYFPFNHVFQKLGVNLQFKGQGGKLQTIMVTSPGPREGKSTVAANLALSLTKAGYKTVLVDMDTHRPTIHRYFGLSNEPRLSEILSSDTAPENIVVETKFPELSVVTNGTMPDNLEEFLLNRKLVEKVLKQLTRHYDYVILDTPAFLALADSIILSTLVDGVLLVVRLGMTQQSLLTTTCQQLTMVHAKVLGSVISYADDGSSTSNYPYYRLNKRRVQFPNVFTKAPTVRDAVLHKITTIVKSIGKQKKSDNQV